MMDDVQSTEIEVWFLVVIPFDFSIIHSQRLRTQLQESQALNSQLQEHFDKVVKPAEARNRELETEIEVLLDKIGIFESENDVITQEVCFGGRNPDRSRTAVCCDEKVGRLREMNESLETQIDELNKLNEDLIRQLEASQNTINVCVKIDFFKGTDEFFVG